MYVEYLFKYFKYLFCFRYVFFSWNQTEGGINGEYQDSQHVMATCVQRTSCEGNFCTYQRCS